MKPLTRVALGAILPILLVVGYAIGTTVSPSPFFPPISRILQKFADLWLFDRIPTDLLPSLMNFTLGYAIAAVTGVLLGLTLGRIRWVADAIMPLLHFARSVPPLMLIPPLILLLGVGDPSKIAIIALGAFFPIVLATIDGIRQTDANHVDAARAMRLTAWQRIVHVWVPSSTPSMFAGLQTGLQFALVLMVSSEMIAATRGVGFLTMQSQITFDAAGVWAGILLLAILGFVLNFLFVLVRNRALAWHIGMRRQANAR
jgi:sulfonate transport system permease protein